MGNIYDTDGFTKDDFKAARASWRKNLCGDENIKNTDVPGMGNLLKMIDADSRELRIVMNRSP